MERETVVYRGTKYHRYPEARRRSDRIYFRSRKGYLHRVMWEDAYGEIPSGHTIHHKDKDSSHNELSNFECKGNVLHLAEHNRERRYDLEHLANIEPLRVAGFKRWVSTPEGKTNLSKRAKKQWQDKFPVIKKCYQCGQEYQTLEPSHSKFCSSNCRASYRRATGKDNEGRQC